MSNITNTLQKLERILKEKSPNLYYSFNPGASTHEFSDFEQSMKMKLTVELKEFYSWRNGMIYNSRAEFLNYFINPLQGLTTYPVKMLSGRTIDNNFKKKNHIWLSILYDGGDNLHYDLSGTMFSKGSIFYLPHDDVIVTQLAPDLGTYLAGVVSCLENGSAFFLDNGSLGLMEQDLREALKKVGFHRKERKLPFRRS